MGSIIHFYDDTSLHITDEQHVAIDKAIDSGAEWINFKKPGTEKRERYKVSNIRKIVDSKDSITKDYRALGLPDMPVPKELEAAYDKRTVTIDATKRLEG